MIKFEVKNRFTGNVQFIAEIDCREDAPRSVKLGLAVNWAIESNANLAGAYLTGAYLVDAYLVDAYLVDANLTGADLTGANLTGANLARANLARANLAGADLARANLSRADLARANLSDANLAGADLARATNDALIIARTRILPEGSLIGWKACANDVVVKLRIPENAKRSHAWGRKCRAESAEVLEVIGAEEGVSKFDGRTTYRVGETVQCDKWCDDWTQECAGGIHFFITRAEAEAW